MGAIKNVIIAAENVRECETVSGTYAEAVGLVEVGAVGGFRSVAEEEMALSYLRDCAAREAGEGK